MASARVSQGSTSGAGLEVFVSYVSETTFLIRCMTLGDPDSVSAFCLGTI